MKSTRSQHPQFMQFALGSAALAGLLLATGCSSSKPDVSILGNRNVVPQPYYDPNAPQSATSGAASGAASNTAAMVPKASANTQLTLPTPPPAASASSFTPSPTTGLPPAKVDPLPLTAPPAVSKTPELNFTPLTDPGVSKSSSTKISSSVPKMSATTSTAGGSLLMPENPAGAGAGTTYKVEKGDSLWSIAKKHGTTVAALTAANGMKDSDKLVVGKELKIPGGSTKGAAAAADLGSPVAAVAKSSSSKTASFLSDAPGMKAVSADPSAAKTAVAGGATYTVEKGDSLSKIAKHHGLTLEALQQLNPGVTDKINVGQKLNVPAGSGATGSKAEPAKADAKTETAHKDHKSSSAPTAMSVTPAGGSPAPAHTSTVKTTPKAAKEMPANGQYTVAAGDSLWKISNSYGVSVENLKKYNNLSSNNLQVGKVLVLKDGVTASAPSATPAATPAPVAAAAVSPAQAGTGAGAVHTGTAPAPAPTAAKVGGPVATKTAPATTPAPPAGGADFNKLVQLTHYVDPQDTLQDIAEMYGSKVDWIQKANPNVKTDADLKTVKDIKVPVVDVNASPTAN